jgi:mitochondrial splicing suppressor protein 51
MCSRCLRASISKRGQQLLPVTSRPTIPQSRPDSAVHSRRIHQTGRSRVSGLETHHKQQTDDLLFQTARPNRSTQDGKASRVVLRPNDLFHSFTNSPSPQIRRRAAFMRQNAYCSHPDHRPTRAPTSPNDLENRKSGAMPPAHVRYECPDCGIPVSCSEEHFVSDYESHLEICDQLREINEDDHDLHSGRLFNEFEYPGQQMDEAQINMTNWDTLLYTREFNAVNDDRSMRQVTRLLTYPVTIASVLHELSPYSLKSRLKPEGLRSLSGRHPTIDRPQHD